jgi:ubiquinone/menaquinone biosynthesis C-methylase UbiE
MSRFTNAEYLQQQQYHNSGNLGARIRLHQLFTVAPKDIHRWAFEMLLACSGSQANMLEVGCGRGDLWAKNVDRIPANWQVTLTDFSPGMLDDARANIGNISQRFAMQPADVQQLAFEDASFDTVIAHYMLYHVPNIPQGIAELRRVLKPSGTLHAFTNGQNHMLELTDIVREFFPTDDAFAVDNAAHYFGLENGADLLKTSFADVVMLRYESHLEVTATQPLMDYVTSMIRLVDVDEQRLKALRDKIETHIAEKGFLHITKDSGLFVARGYNHS